MTFELLNHVSFIAPNTAGGILKQNKDSTKIYFSGAANSGIWPNCALSVKSVKLGTNIL